MNCRGICRRNRPRRRAPRAGGIATASTAALVSIVWLTASLLAGSATGQRADGAATEAPATSDWPQHLGPGRDGHVADGPPIEGWPASGPPEVWRREVGEGFAGPAVRGRRLILFHRLGDQEVVEALDVSTGATLWSAAYPTSYRDDFGFDEGPRATPTISGGRVFSCGAQGVLQALDLGTGERRWKVDTHRRFGVRKGWFGAACSPLVADGRVMVNVGGRDGAGIVAFDADSGDVLWTATDHEASYSAPVMATLGGRSSALFFTREGLVEVDPADGTVRAELRWRSRSSASVNAATPLVIDDRVFVSASYATGAALLERDERGFTPIWSSDEILSNHYATSVRHLGYLYGYHGRQEYGPSLRAVELATGGVAWSVDGFGGGTILVAGDRLLVLREGGQLILAEATPEAFRPLARAQILPGTVRAYPAVSDGVLYARNERTLVAVDLGGRGSR